MLLYSSRLLSCCRFCIALLFLAVCLCAPFQSRADIRECSDNIVGVLTARTLERLPTLKLSYPANLASDRDVYLLVTMGGAYVDVRLLGRPSVSPQELAAMLDRALQNISPQPEHIEWSREDDYSAACFAFSQGHWGKTAGVTTFPLGRLVAGLKAQHLQVHGVLRVPTYAHADLLSLPSDAGTNSVWYQADAAAPDVVVSVSANMTPGENALAWFLAVGVTIVGVAGLLAALVFARASALEKAKRRYIFIRIAISPLWATVGITTAIGFFYMSSTWAARAADLWMGNMQRSSTATFLLLNIPVFMLLNTVAFVLQVKLFAEPPTPEQQAVSLATQDERRI